MAVRSTFRFQKDACARSPEPLRLDDLTHEFVRLLVRSVVRGDVIGRHQKRADGDGSRRPPTLAKRRRSHHQDDVALLEHAHYRGFVLSKEWRELAPRVGRTPRSDEAVGFSHELDA